ncbi:MAG: chromate transporter [Oscillospiraceae bacterium]|nr:chromate transporter [Oscillospiraceae bacterium]
MKELLSLYLAFMRIGGLTFGGGLTMLPMLKYELVEKKNWIDEETLLECYAIGQCTPGIIAVNTATFVGYKQRGDIGGVVATVGLVFPSLIIITVIAAFLSNFAEFRAVQNAFAGIRACVCVLMINTVVKLWKTTIVSKLSVIIFAAVLLLSLFTTISTAIIVILAGVIGVSVSIIRKRRAK